MNSIYWVFTLKCNDFCDHCYNNSGPRGEAIGIEELLKVVPQLPSSFRRMTLSGGEPLVERKKLYAIVAKLRERFGQSIKICLQSNGDLLSSKALSEMEEVGTDRIDIVSIDRFHKQKGQHVEKLKQIFEQGGWVAANSFESDNPESQTKKEYYFWGADEDFFLGGLWARGRALKNNLALMNPKHNFCSLLSGAKGFLDEGADNQDIHIQLTRLYPCCPTTHKPIGDVRDNSVDHLLAQAAQVPAYKTLNKGDIFGLGEEEGLSRDFIAKRIEELGDVCLWCDEYFQKHHREHPSAQSDI